MNKICIKLSFVFEIGPMGKSGKQSQITFAEKQLQNDKTVMSIDLNTFIVEGGLTKFSVSVNLI